MSELAKKEENCVAEQNMEDSETNSDNADTEDPMTEKEELLEDILKECVELCKPLIQYISTVIVTLGQHGVVVCRDVPFETPFTADGKIFGVDGERKHGRPLSAMHYPASTGDQSRVDVVSVTGAGDR